MRIALKEILSQKGDKGIDMVYVIITRTSAYGDVIVDNKGICFSWETAEQIVEEYINEMEDYYNRVGYTEDNFQTYNVSIYKANENELIYSMYKEKEWVYQIDKNKYEEQKPDIDIWDIFGD